MRYDFAVTYYVKVTRWEWFDKRMESEYSQEYKDVQRYHCNEVSYFLFYCYHIRNLRRNRQYISLFVAKTIATALVNSIHDYCNSLFHNTSNKEITKL